MCFVLRTLFANFFLFHVNVWNNTNFVGSLDQDVLKSPDLFKKRKKGRDPFKKVRIQSKSSALFIKGRIPTTSLKLFGSPAFQLS